MQNLTTGVGHTEGLLHFGCTSLPVIGTVFDCQLSHVEPETPCADGSHVIKKVYYFSGLKPQTGVCPFFAWQQAVKIEQIRVCTLKNGQKSPDMVMSGRDYCEHRNKNKY